MMLLSLHIVAIAALAGIFGSIGYKDGSNFIGLIYFSFVALIQTSFQFFLLVKGTGLYLSRQADGLSWFRLLFDKRETSMPCPTDPNAKIKHNPKSNPK